MSQPINTCNFTDTMQKAPMQRVVGNSRRADLTFRRNGQIDISAHVAKLLNLQNGDVVDVIQSYDETFLSVVQRSGDILGRHEGTCCQSNPHGKHFRTYSKKICKYIFDLCGCDDQNLVALPIGEKRDILGVGTVLHIITKNILFTK